MNEDIVIDVKNISKKYTISTGYQADTLREKIVELAKYPIRALRGHHHKPKTKEYWALKDVSFQVKRGEVLGIIGKNGAGKSTLLKILSRTTEPTSGSITMKGKVSSLLEVGTGFNPELTGRENIYLNGAILGMGKREISAKFNDIVAFAGIGEFLDTPVKRYSSGMYIRLAFSVAVHLDSDILILDEVLAVGDSDFQKKSLKKMFELAKSGKTVLFVSHNSEMVKKLCSTTALLKSGNLEEIGETYDIINKYLENKVTVQSKGTYIFNNLVSDVRINEIDIGYSGVITNKIPIDQNINLNIKYTINKNTPNATLSVLLYKDSNLILLSSESDSTAKLKTYRVGKYETTVIIPKFLLNTGLYDLEVAFHRPLLEYLDKQDSMSIEILNKNNPKAKIFKGRSDGIVASILEYTTLVK